MLQAVTNDELYGIINPATREWKDGLFSAIMRDQANLTAEGPKWIILDGDIDPMWIESLNTVMYVDRRIKVTEIKIKCRRMVSVQGRQQDPDPCQQRAHRFDARHEVDLRDLELANCDSSNSI